MQKELNVAGPEQTEQYQPVDNQGDQTIPWGQH